MPNRSTKSKSNRITTRQRHKVQRKIREKKRDIRKAAKVMKKSGFKVRSKKSREVMKQVLRISNANPEKERILEQILQVREVAKVERAKKRLGENDATQADAKEGQPPVAELPSTSSVRRTLLIPTANAYDAQFQFSAVLGDLKEIAPVFGVCVDARCTVESCPWAMVEQIVEARLDAEQPKKRARSESTSSSRKTTIVFIITKIDLVSLEALNNQFNALAAEVASRFGSTKGGVEYVCLPFSSQYERTAKHVFKVLHHLLQSEVPTPARACCCLVGLPNSGRSTLARSVLEAGSASSVVIAPLRTVHSVSPKNEGDEAQKIVVPGAKSVTFLTLPDTNLGKEILAGDVIYSSPSSVEKLSEPEVPAMLLVDSFFDRAALCQLFAMPLAEKPEFFLKGLGRSILREGGFHVAPFVKGTSSGSELSSNLLCASTDVLMSGSLVKVFPKRSDGRNTLRVGARCFLKEFCSGRNLLWATRTAERPVEDGIFASPVPDDTSARSAFFSVLSRYIALTPKVSLLVKSEAVLPATGPATHDEETVA